MSTDATIEDFLTVMLLTPIGEPDLPPSHHSVIWGVPVLLEGLSGVSKTKKVRACSKALGIDAHYVYAGPKQPEDFGGMPVLTADGVVMDCVLPAAKRCINAGGGLIVLDEINGASPRTQNALLSFVDERQIGDIMLPPKTRFVLCMNPVEYAAGGHIIEAAFANRIAHRDFSKPTNDEWGAWLRGAKKEMLPIKEAEQIVITRWFDHWPQVVGLGSGFANRVRPDILHNQPEPGSPHASKAWPSFRTWYMGLRAMCTARCLQDQFVTSLGRSDDKRSPDETARLLARAQRSKVEMIQHEILKSLVGEGPANEWQTWVAEADLPEPTEMLTQGFTPKSDRLDWTLACLTSMTEFVKTRQRADQLRYAEAAWKILMKCIKFGQADLVITHTQALLGAGLGRGRQDIPKAVEEAADNVVFDLTEMGYEEYAT
jgi:hypothetical protein